jgi:hypothetical protein
MRITYLVVIISAFTLCSSFAWSQEAEGVSNEPSPTTIGETDQKPASELPQKQRGMMKGPHGKGPHGMGGHGMGGHGMKHGSKESGRGKGHEMKHGHHQDVLNRLDRIEKRQILIETMLRELLLNER